MIPRRPHIVITLLVLVFLAAGAAFWWYELRPRSIRQTCLMVATTPCNPDSGSDLLKRVLAHSCGSNELLFDQEEYDRCLIERGL